MWYKIEGQTIYLSISVKLNAKQTSCLRLVNNKLVISIHAPPIEGKANAELIVYLAKMLMIPKSKIKIIRGMHSKQKLLSLPFTEKIRELLQNIEQGSITD